jgi:hypothetical protein
MQSESTWRNVPGQKKLPKLNKYGEVHQKQKGLIESANVKQWAVGQSCSQACRPSAARELTQSTWRMQILMSWDYAEQLAQL